MSFVRAEGVQRLDAEYPDDPTEDVRLLVIKLDQTFSLILNVLYRIPNMADG
jgi:hypothetical protein